MRPFDEVVDRLTGRLKGDPELRAEVGNELKGHLEQSAKEFVAAGRSEEEAWGEAVRAMGDEREVAEGLWEGNRRRMAKRRVARWVVGGTLVSAAGVGAVVIAWGAVVSVAVALSTVAMLGSKETTSYFGDRVFRAVADGVRAGRVERMSPDARAVFEAGEGEPAERIARSAALVGQARDPGDRVLFAAHYAMQTLLDHGATSGVVADRAKFERALEAMEAGKRAEPGNGFYALAEASLLLGASTVDAQLPDDVQPPPWRFGLRDAEGRATAEEFYDYKVTDPAMYARGLEQLREAARAEYVNSHVAEFASRRLAAMGPGTRLADEYLKAREDLRVMMPHLNEARGTIGVAGAQAIRLAQQGKVAEGLDLVKAGREVSRKMVESANGPVIELLVGAGMYEATVAQEAMVHRIAGNGVKFAEARGRLEALRRAVRQRSVTGPAAVAEYASLIPRAGVLDAMFLRSGTRARAALPGLAPGRRAEYAVADQIGVAVWVMVLVLAGLWPVAGVVWHRLSTGRWPVGVFVGWRRLARVVLWAVVLPVGVYVLYAAVPEVGGRDLALRVGWDRLLVEYTAVGCAIVILVRVVGRRAVSERARELGRVVEVDRVGWARKMIGGLLAAAVLAYLVAWQVTARQAAWEGGVSSMGVMGVLLSALLVAYAAGWCAGGWGGSEDWRKELPGWVAPAVAIVGGVVLAAMLYGNYGYRSGRAIADVTSLIVPVVAVALLVVGAMRAVRGRSSRVAARVTFGYGLTMAPVVLTAAIVLAVVGGGGALWAERRSVMRMEELNGGGMRLASQIERSNLAAVREVILAPPGSL